MNLVTPVADLEADCNKAKTESTTAVKFKRGQNGAEEEVNLEVTGRVSPNRLDDEIHQYCKLLGQQGGAEKDAKVHLTQKVTQAHKKSTAMPGKRQRYRKDSGHDLTQDCSK